MYGNIGRCLNGENRVATFYANLFDHIANVYKKAGTHNRFDLARFANTGINIPKEIERNELPSRMFVPAYTALGDRKRQ